MRTEQAVVKLKLSKPPPTGIEKYQYLQRIRKQEQMRSFRDLLRWYKSKDVVPTLEAMQKLIAFYHDKDIHMLKLGCTLPNLANICLYKSTDAKFYTFTGRNKELLEKVREEFVGGPSIVSTRKAVVDENLFECLQAYANLLLGLMPANYIPTRCVNPCLPVFIPVGIWTQKRRNSHLDKTKPAALKKWSCPISNEQDQNVKLKGFLQKAER